MRAEEGAVMIADLEQQPVTMGERVRGGPKCAS
jgi:hypothetical protein